jgi:hypothetical protein
LLSRAAQASSGGEEFLIWFVVTPVVVVVALALLVTCIAVTRRFRPIAASICVIPLAPVSNGSYFWPLGTYAFFGWDGGISLWALIWPTASTMLVVYVVAKLLLRSPGSVTPPNTSLERTREG